MAGQSSINSWGGGGASCSFLGAGAPVLSFCGCGGGSALGVDAGREAVVEAGSCTAGPACTSARKVLTRSCHGRRQGRVGGAGGRAASGGERTALKEQALSTGPRAQALGTALRHGPLRDRISLSRAHLEVPVECERGGHRVEGLEDLGAALPRLHVLRRVCPVQLIHCPEGRLR